MDRPGETNGKPTVPSQIIAKEDPLSNISGRMLDSATGLLRDSFSPSGSHQASILAGVLASENKAGPSTSSPITDGATPSERIRESAKSHQGFESLPGSDGAFRERNLANGGVGTQSVDAAGGMSLDQFIQYENEVPYWQHTGEGKGKQRAVGVDKYVSDPHTEAKMSAVWENVVGQEKFQTLPTSSSMEQDKKTYFHRAVEFYDDDGGEVVRLLQDLNFHAMTEPLDRRETDIPIMISAEDKRIAEDIVRSIESKMRSSPGYKVAMEAANKGRPFSEFSSFFDDIENYHDEVWGYLQPIVESARAENTFSGSPAEEVGPATRRLRMIFAHINELD